MASLRTFFLAMSLLGLISATGCGEDPAPSGGSKNNDDDDDDKTPTKKDAGSNKDAGSTKDAGKAAAGVKCGSKTCSPVMLPFPGLPMPTPCCFDEDEEVCSAEGADGECAAPAKLDPRCPDVNLLGALMVKGCCTDGDMCGIDSSQLGMGCRDLADPMLRQLPGLPEARVCGEEPKPKPPTDAGTTKPADAGSPMDAGAKDAGKTDAK